LTCIHPNTAGWQGRYHYYGAKTMDQETWTAVDRYLAKKLIPADPALDAAQAATAAANMPAISVSPTQGKLLELFAMTLHARSILEIGTLGGYSTIWLARGLAPGGRIVTLEKVPSHADVARANIARAGFADVVDLRVGSALDTLPQLAAEDREPFDLVFIDADKQNIPAYFDWAVTLAHPGSMIIVDNVVRDGDVINDDTEDTGTHGVRRFFDRLSTSALVTSTAIQTVGVKGYDGFAVSIVN